MAERERTEWSVFTPAKLAGRGKWMRIVEFDMTTTMWQEIYSACVSAVEDYMSNGSQQDPAPKTNMTDGSQKTTTPAPKLDDVVFEVSGDPINLDDITVLVTFI